MGSVVGKIDTVDTLDRLNNNLSRARSLLCMLSISCTDADRGTVLDGLEMLTELVSDAIGTAAELTPYRERPCPILTGPLVVVR